MPRPTLQDHFRESWALARANLGQTCVLMAAAFVPTALLAMLAFLITGFTDGSQVQAAFEDGEGLRALPLVVAGLAKKAAQTLLYVSLLVSVRARRDGRPLSPREAVTEAIGLFIPFFYTAVIVVLRMAPALLLMLIPVAGPPLAYLGIVVLAVRYCLSPLAVVLEGERGRAAVLRSVELMSTEPKRSWGYMAAGFLASGFGYLLAADPVNLLIGLGNAAFEGGLGPVAAEFIGLVADSLAGFVLSWFLAYSFVVYQDLAAEKPASI